MPVALEKADRDLAEIPTFKAWPEPSQPSEILRTLRSFPDFKRNLGTSSYTMSSQELPFKILFPQETTNVLVEIEETLRYIQNISVMIPNVSDARNYLLRYPDIITILVTVCEATLEHFGRETQLSLEVYRDPEIEDEYLTLYVRQKKYTENIMKEIKKIRSMYEIMLVNKTGWFLVTTDFRAPQE